MKHSVIRPSRRGPYNPFAPSVLTSQDTERTISSREAIVADVITNDKHPEYASDGYNIGAIKFRSIVHDSYRPEENLNWALPADTNISEYPLLHEIVIVFVSLNRWYYHRRLNITSGITSHSTPGLHTELSATGKPQDQQANRDAATNGTPVVVTAPDTSAKLGSFFKEPTNVYRLRHDEGDILFQGRSGHSIRLGAAWKTGTIFQSTTADQSPNLILRVGQDPNAKPSVNTPYGLVSEDINKDASSLYMVSDQLIPLEYSTKKAAIHQKSIKDFPKRLDGSQVVINTNRLVLNTRMGKIMGFALDGVHWTSSKDFTVDADRDYLSQITGNAIYNIGGMVQSTAKSHAFIAPKNYLGSQNDEAQPIPAGAMLAQFLQNLIKAFTSNPNIVLSTGQPGAPSILNPNILVALDNLLIDAARGAQASFNSKNSFTVK